VTSGFSKPGTSTQPVWRKSWVTADLDGESGIEELEAPFVPRRSKAKIIAAVAVVLAVVGGALGLAFTRRTNEPAPAQTPAQVQHVPDEKAATATPPVPVNSVEPAPPVTAGSADSTRSSAPATPRGKSAREPRTNPKRGSSPEKLNQISTANPYRQRAPK
jgi:hypothetical protein